MTIAGEFNKITEKLGGDPSTSGTITGAIDALNDTLAGSDQPAALTVEGAVRLLGEHINGGEKVDAVIELNAELKEQACEGTLVEGDFAAIREKAANNEPISVSVRRVANEAVASMEYGELFVFFDTYSLDPDDHHLYVAACGIDLGSPTPSVYVRPIFVYENEVALGSLAYLANSE